MYLLTHNAGYSALRHVVDDVCAKLFYTLASHQWAIRVYRHNGVGLLAAHNGKGTLEALCLLLHAHHLGTRTCGEGSHVYHLASLGDDLVGTLGYLSLRLLAATRVERVGCGV